jgi:hypothetical protein
MIPFPLNTNTVTIAPTTTTRNVSQNAQHIHVRCLDFFFWLSSQLSLCDGSAVTVVQNLKELLGRPDKPSERPELLKCFVKRLEVRFDLEPEEGG